MPELWIHRQGVPSDCRRMFPANVDLPKGFVSEGNDYVVELRDNTANAIEALVDDLPLLALRNSYEGYPRWLWCPGFYAGVVDLCLVRHGTRVWEGTVTLDPDKAKFSRDQFDLMTEEILNCSLALFSISAAKKGVAKGLGEDAPPIARLEYLRSRLDQIEAAVREIDAAPVRTLEKVVRRVDTAASHGVTGAELLNSFRLETLRAMDGGLFHEMCEGRFPEKIRRSVRKPRMDLAEHRAIRTQLVTWRSWLQLIAARLERTNKEKEEKDTTTRRIAWARRCRVLAGRLKALLDLPLFRDVSSVRQPMALTSVFRWSPTYRRFFKLSLDFQLGLARVGGDFLQIPIARTFDLYELWTFLRLLKGAVELFGLEEIDVGGLFAMKDGSDEIELGAPPLRVRLADKLELCFQRTYREYWLTKPAGSPGSFSRPMIPDVSMEASSDGPTTVIVFDAKYRVEAHLSDALASLHLYRDAVVQETEGKECPGRVVLGAYLLTPHVPPDSVDAGKGHWKELTVPDLLFHPAYRGAFRFGALTMRPGMSDSQVIRLLKAALVDAGVMPA